MGGGAPIRFENVTTTVAEIPALGNANLTFTIPSITGYTYSALIYSGNNKSPNLLPYNVAVKYGSGSLSVHSVNNAALSNVTFVAIAVYVKND